MHFRLLNVFDDICRRSFSYWFDVKWSTFHKDMRKNDFCIFVPSDFDLCPFYLRIISPF